MLENSQKSSQSKKKKKIIIISVWVCLFLTLEQSFANDEQTRARMELIDERENQKVVDENLHDYGSANQSKGIVYALCRRYQKKINY